MELTSGRRLAALPSSFGGGLLLVKKVGLDEVFGERAAAGCAAWLAGIELAKKVFSLFL